MKFIQEMIAKKKAVHEADLEAAGVTEESETSASDVVSLEEAELRGEPNELPDGMISPVDGDADRPSADILHYRGQDGEDEAEAEPQDDAEDGAQISDPADVPGFSLLLGDVNEDEPDPAPEAMATDEDALDEEMTEAAEFGDPDLMPPSKPEPDPAPEAKDVWAEAEEIVAKRAEEARHAEMFPEVSPQPKIAEDFPDEEPDDDDLIGQIEGAETEAPASQGRKIWDMQDPDQYAPPASSPIGKEEAAIAAATANAPDPRPAGGRRANRVKTRLLGFASAEDLGANVFDAQRNKAPSGVVMEPVGWLIVLDGPGRGASFPLLSGVSQIGRGADQAVRLDFGDTSISRDNHASIAFDEEQHKFFIGHGGKSNLVRLNNKPILSTEEMSHHDMIRIGETTLRFIALCGPEFSWTAPEGDNVDHAANS